MTAVRVLFVAIIAMHSLVHDATGAEVARASAPRLVLARTVAVRLVDENNQSRAIPVGLVLDVLRVEGDWLWTGRGWVRSSEVVGIEQAVEFFTAEIDRAPDSYQYVARARARAQISAYDEALADADRALAIDPKSAPAHCQRGRALLGLRRANEALDALSRAIEIDPNGAIAFCVRAQTRNAMGDAATAMDDYDRAIELDEKLDVARFGRAALRSQAGDVEGALNDLTNVLLRNPQHFLALNNRANLYAKQGRWEPAVADYTAALQVVRRPDILRNRAHALRTAGKVQAAIADCDEAIRLEPNSEVAYRQRAAMLEEAGRGDDADRDRRQAKLLAAGGSRT